MSAEDLPEPDRVEGAHHPRETPRLVGQGVAERAFLSAFSGGRLHHGWLLTGPEGVGKATLAWRIARFLIATPVDDGSGLLGAPPAPDTLDIGADHPVMRRTMALSEPSLFVLRRGANDKGDRLAAEIRVQEVRDLKRRMALSSADGGRRVILVDAVDDLNVSAANALLKLLEEPPANTVLLLVCHRPARLLPTIRSRCRELRLSPLGPEAMAEALAAAGAAAGPEEADALTELSAGSVGAAIRLSNLGGLELYGALMEVLSTLPDLDRPRALALADRVATRGREAELDLLLGLTDLALARLARAGVTSTPPPRPAHAAEPSVIARLAPDPAAGRAWADIAQTAAERARRGRAVNIDAAALVFDMLTRMRETAASVAA
ncbi:DNA polymerase III subunit delta' [Roseivivax sediminis]|uniref:DNA polymerase III, delta prime subunit n=1 Tax=Roseivivax sediminis TaxID=936889 RepID=A0A1I1VUD2_9RHOB|nr:DNA polymerase III subunit delta' [Roseivivax sediminis]SFD84150.1 DNA polymerase III, delta prime subunit [Roseivivax sediminis]